MRRPSGTLPAVLALVRPTSTNRPTEGYLSLKNTAMPGPHLSRYLDDVVAQAPAKVNLFLEVLGKRPDGYHEIATLMVAVRLCDTLVFADDPGGRVTLECHGAALSTGSDNLVVRAANLLRERTGSPRGCRVRLIKRIPMAAGLAGGSSDAAATLAGLNRLWGLKHTMTELAELGAELGSDVPFFFQTPAAWCTGRGEVVEPVAMKEPLELVLLCPSFGMPTAQVYRTVRVPAQPHSGEAMRAALATGNTEEVGRRLFNRLQEAAQALDERITQYDERLANLQPAGHLMSGSGSTLFALCRSAAEARQLVDALEPAAAAEQFRIFRVRSCA